MKVPLMAVAVAVSALGCGPGTETPLSSQQENQSVAPESEARSVPVTAVTAQAFERMLSLSGDLVAFQDVAIHARVQGFVEAISVDRGAVVRRGATLARVVAPELSAHLSEAEARVQTAEAQLLEAQAEFGSERSTFERLEKASATPGVVAGNDVEVARQRVEALRARVEASVENVEAIRQAARAVREMESYLHVTAPFDGVVTERVAHVGTLVGPSLPPIARMQEISTLRLVAAIPEAYVSGMTVGQAIEFTLSTFPGETFSGELARIARALDPTTRTMAVEIAVNNGSGRLAPGMFAEIRWPARRATSSLFVPRTAVTTTTERTFVVRVRDGVAEWVDVRRGAAMDGLIEVFGDLEPGDVVALRGTDELREGTRVRAEPPPVP